MEAKQIKELMSAMVRFDMSDVTWREGDSQIELKRGPTAHPQSEGEEWSHRPVSPLPSHANLLPSHSSDSGEGSAHPQSEGEGIIQSPMVGTLYLTPAPHRPPYVKVGDTVTEESVVCVIEAMKVMNEIRAPFAGKVVEILMESENPVEYGSHLMRIA